MIGRLSVGNLTDLAAVVNKSTNYMPVASGAGWSTRVLLIGGLFYTIKDDYVALFDEYEEIIPDEFQVDRIYRHDFATDGACALEVVEGFNNGCLIANFAGDGWISTWDRTLSTAHIAQMENSDRLPIVLSMACATGWFDNTTYPDAGGSYDCLAEQLVNATNKGAIACLAAPRSSDGGMFRTLTESLYRAVFDEQCIFIGEASPSASCSISRPRRTSTTCATSISSETRRSSSRGTSRPPALPISRSSRTRRSGRPSSRARTRR